jgi:hypothetical protein
MNQETVKKLRKIRNGEMQWTYKLKPSRRMIRGNSSHFIKITRILVSIKFARIRRMSREKLKDTRQD